MHKLIRYLHIAEDSILVTLTLTTIVLGATQIVLRNMGVTGLIWMDPASRVAVLWLAMFGALRASREQKHIVIDLLSHYSKPLMRKITFFIVSVATAIICFWAAYYGYAFVLDEYKSDFDLAFLNVPTWATEIIIPVSFTLIGVRSLIYSLSPPEMAQKPESVTELDQERIAAKVIRTSGN